MSLYITPLVSFGGLSTKSTEWNRLISYTFGIELFFRAWIARAAKQGFSRLVISASDRMAY